MKYLSPIDLNKCELQNARIHNLGTAPSSPVEGQIYYDSTTGDKSIYFWNGSSWIDVGGDIRSITGGDAISVTGTRDLTISAKYDDVMIGVNGSDQLFIKDASITNAKLVNSSITVTAGNGLANGGSVSLGGSVTLNVGAGTGITVNANDVALDTANTRNVDHASVSISAGNGLTGGGTIAASRTINVGAGTGITVNANDVALKNAGSLTDNTISMWDDTNGQFVNSSISDDGTTVTISNNLTVSGTITYIDSNTVEIGDNIILLNRDETGTPSQDAGLEIERGTSTNVSFLWDESSGYWSTVNEEFHIGSIPAAGGAYTGDKILVSDGGQVEYLTTDELAADIIGSTGYAATGPGTGGTSWAVTHNLNSRDVLVQVYDASTYEQVMCDITRNDVNIVTLNFCSSQTANSLRIVISKVA